MGTYFLLLIAVTTVAGEEIVRLGTVGNKSFMTPAKDKAVTWGFAKSFCVIYNHKLATISNKAENDLVGDYLMKLARSGESVDHGWLGGNDLETKGTWLWVHNKQPLTFKNWASGEPGTPGANNYSSCMLMSPSKTWDATYCSEKLGRAICSRQVN